MQRKILYISMTDEKRRVPERSKNDVEIAFEDNKKPRNFPCDNTEILHSKGVLFLFNP